ncbi:MAG: hypothetical protein FJ279_09260 [Planctomycetes bacterium]|nr:hypothetical protein [Planctomycetota bacterium]MBM4078051.1 hypothetical protein [Planctomycetota bacterium]
MRVGLIALLVAAALAFGVSLTYAQADKPKKEETPKQEAPKLCKHCLDEAIAKCPKKGQKDCPLANVKPVEKHSECIKCNPPKKEKDKGHGGHQH